MGEHTAVIVRRSSNRRTWDVVVNGQIVEGGFFDRALALDCAAQVRSDLARQLAATKTVVKMLGGTR